MIHHPLLGAAGNQGGGAKVYATWNPLDKNGFALLSNGDLTINVLNNQADSVAARTTIGKTSGVWYFEPTVDVSHPSCSFGACNAESPLRFSTFPNANVNVGTVYQSNGSYMGGAGGSSSNAYFQPWSSMNVGSVIGIIIDADNRKIGVINDEGVFTGWHPNAIAGVSPIYPVTFCYSNGVVTSNFGPTPFQWFAVAQAAAPTVNEGFYSLV